MKKVLFLILFSIMLTGCGKSSDIRNEMKKEAIPVYKEMKEMMTSGKVNADYNGSVLFSEKFLALDNRTSDEKKLLYAMNEIWSSIIDGKLSSLDSKSKDESELRKTYLKNVDIVEKLLGI